MTQYLYLFIPISAVFLAQLIKFSLESLKSKELKWGRLLNGSGGMPSSHTTFTVSLTTAIGFHEGMSSPLFAICVVFTGIVIYDSMGLRMESGKQATVINQIVDEIFSKDLKQGIVHLKEQLGHNPSEVLAGLLFGFFYSWAWTLLI